MRRILFRVCVLVPFHAACSAASAFLSAASESEQDPRNTASGKDGGDQHGGFSSSPQGHKDKRVKLTEMVTTGVVAPAPVVEEKKPKNGPPATQEGVVHLYDDGMNLPDESLDAYLEALLQHQMAAHGDDRLVIKNGVNKYFIPPHPMPDAIHR